MRTSFEASNGLSPEAFLVHKGTLYFSTAPINENSLDTAVTILIRGICERHPGLSLALLRERIFSRAPLTYLCEGMVKVAAKRYSLLSQERWMSAFEEHTGSFSEISPPAVQEFPLPFSLVGMEIGPHQVPEQLLLLKGFARGLRPVSAILTGQDHRILAYSWSETNQNRTAHAELGLIHSFLNEKLPAKVRGATLWVSLRPCAMCSAQILRLMTILPDLKIRFLEEDHGPASKNSCLFAGSDLWKKAGSPRFNLAQIERSDSCFP